VRPTLFEIGGLEFPAYLTFVMSGFLAAIWYARKRAEAGGVPGVFMVDLGILMLISGIAGARLLAVLTDGFLLDFVNLCTDPSLVDAHDAKARLCASDQECGFDYLCNLNAREAVLSGQRKTMCYPPRDCLATLKFWEGGLTFYGGLLAALPTGLWFARRKGVSRHDVANIAAPAIALGLAIGRLGCFFNGCCYGSTTEGFLGVHFPKQVDPRHPTQLYESAFALALFLLLHLRSRSGRDNAFPLFLTLYGGYRLVIELVRDDPRGALGPLSTSQLVSIPLVLAGIWLLLRERRRRPDA
jgi:phosphatidylglycerol:prolipoprotein diacylglycerol transferase